MYDSFIGSGGMPDGEPIRMRTSFEGSFSKGLISPKGTNLGTVGDLIFRDTLANVSNDPFDTEKQPSINITRPDNVDFQFGSSSVDISTDSNRNRLYDSSDYDMEFILYENDEFILSIVVYGIVFTNAEYSTERSAYVLHNSKFFGKDLRYKKQKKTLAT